MELIFPCDQEVTAAPEHLNAFFKSLNQHKSNLELKSQIKFENNLPLTFKVPLILSTGGYNDQFLLFLSLSFRTQIVKCHEYLHFVVKAIDYLNTNTNDAMFKLHGPVNTKIN